MKSYDEMQYNSTAERLVQILCAKTGNSEPLFFRVMVAYYFAKVASMMRCNINTHDRGVIPVNLYALNLSPSGTGKGHSTGIVENEILHLFRERFINETMPVLAEQNLPKLAVKRANRKGTDPDEELVAAQREYERPKVMPFAFSEVGSTAAVKSLRHKLLMAEAGALNLEIDEIGSNLAGSREALDLYLELYDVGTTKPKLTKDTNDNKQVEEIIGRTPANALMFGTPSKLLDGSKTEEELYSLLETGYARRCFFGYASARNGTANMTPEEIYAMRTNTDASAYMEELANRLDALGDIINANKALVMSKSTALLAIEYQQRCEREAMKLADHEALKAAELSHRYYKSLKLAGAYAFIDDSPELTEDHLYQAIKLAEDSGAAFQKLLSRDKPYMKLAKYIADCKNEVTVTDLAEDLPFYKGTASARNDMMTLAIAWGYKNNIIIKKSFNDGIEFLRGETLEKTDLKKMVVAYSTDIVSDYRSELAPFDHLHKLTQAPGLHWVAHHLVDGYRNEENAIAGFNLLVFDVDGGVNLSTAQMLLKDYKYLVYTTKRHTPDEHRFRIILPLNYTLKLDAQDYREFYKNVMEWLPFGVDDQVGQRARKWLSHNGHYEYNEGMLLDALPFIPKTAKNEKRKELLNTQQAMDNLERWVCNNIGDGNRNNMLLRYAMILVDAGFDFEGVRTRVIDLNDKVADKLDVAEIMGTIMVTVAKKLASK